MSGMCSVEQQTVYPSAVKMESAFVLVICAVAAVNGQLLGPMSTMGMGVGWGTPMWHSGMRYPGVMQTSQVNSMTYPTWRSHPIFRISSADKTFGTNVPSDVSGIAKPTGAQEVLTHMALAVQNPKPYVDTITDFFYEPQKVRTVFTPVVPVPSLTPLSSVATAVPAGSKSYIDTVSEVVYEPPKARAVLTPVPSTGSVVSVAPVGAVAPVAPVAPVTSVAPGHVQGVNLMRANVNTDDCVQENAKWERGMDWLY